ncbi:MAG: LysM peptidoglycan-binding domain-containing protein [Methylacidiphilales bacterium]|nr:LysM peptidoglycan-binding domain-containing protein [Candidatus Methylacidiphilales bacterium]
MTTRYFSSSLLCALALVVAPIHVALAQAAAPADTSSSNAAPAAPPAPMTPAAPAPAETQAPPAPADTNVAPVAPTERPTTYTIVKGDSLWSIAHHFGTTVVSLRKANNLKKGALLHPGQVLQIPPATSDTTAK